MRRWSRFLTGYVLRCSLGMLLLAVTACAGETPAPSTPTPELVVVVFETEEPTPPAPQPTNSPAPGPTAGFGVQSKPTEATSNLPVADTAASTSSPVNRPPDENPLTGLKVDDPALLHRPPLMVRVGNDPAARPQVALDKADIVYEEIVEWWVTRFTAIYLSQEPATIAPIRSARLINLQLTPQYQGALANSGGSDEVRWELSQSDLINLDEFFTPQPYFYRPNEGWQTRLAFDATSARDYLHDEGLDSGVNLRGFVFSQPLDVSDFPPEAVGEATEVIVPYPQQTSEAEWQYDPGSGQYLRFTSGEPMLTSEGNQIAASNVIIYFAEHQPTDIVEDSNGATSIRIIVNGLGTAWVARDGKIIKGNWQTDGRETPDFFLNDGRTIPLKPGNTWVEIVPLDYLIEIDGASQPRLSTAESTETETGGPESTPETTASPTATPIGARSAQTPAATATP